MASADINLRSTRRIPTAVSDTGARPAGTRPGSRSPPDGSDPPHLGGLVAQQYSLEHVDRLREAFVDRGEAVLVLDAEHAVVAGYAKRTDEVAPELLVLAVADAAERPRPVRET